MMPTRPSRSRFLFLFLFFTVLICLPALPAADIPCVWTGVNKIVAVGDLHGAYDGFLEILKRTNIVDERLRWIAGKTHLVQMGDVMDRGPDARRIFDLMMKLEKEAAKAGGKIHALIGNHEMMNVTRIAFDYPGYVVPEQFVSFLPEKYKKLREKDFAEHIVGKDIKEIDTDLSTNQEIRNWWQAVIRIDPEARMKYSDHFNSVYGRWIMENNAVIKINEVVFVHGGISPGYSTVRIKDINRKVREELGSLSKLPGPGGNGPNGSLPSVFDPAGPLWYRDLAWSNDPELAGEVDKILANLKASHMVIAHSYRVGSLVAPEEMMSRYQGKVWSIDTGISSVYGGYLSALIIENGKFTPWWENDEKQNLRDLAFFIDHRPWSPL